MQIAVEILIVVVVLGFVLYPLVNARAVPSTPPKSDLESEILKLRRKKAMTCAKCGAANPADARFCSACAAKLTKEN